MAPLSMGLSRQEYWSGCHFLFRESSHHRDQTWITSTEGTFFTVWAIREAILSSSPKSRWGPACFLTFLSSLFVCLFCSNSTMKWLGLCHVFPLSLYLPSFLQQTASFYVEFLFHFCFCFSFQRHISSAPSPPIPFYSYSVLRSPLLCVKLPVSPLRLT